MGGKEPPYALCAATNAFATLSPGSDASGGTVRDAQALNSFLAAIEHKAFRMAQIALRHEHDALDAVQDAMLQLARRYAARPVEEWRPLFYRILENRIRDIQRRRTVRGRVMAWLPALRSDDAEAGPDPVQTAPDPAPGPVARLGNADPGGARDRLQKLPSASGRPSCCGTSRAWMWPRPPPPWVVPMAA